MELTDSSRVRWTRREIRLHLFMLFVHFSQAERSLYGVSLTKTYFSAAAIFATVTV